MVVVRSGLMHSEVVFPHCLYFFLDPDLTFLAGRSRCVRSQVLSLITC